MIALRRLSDLIHKDPVPLTWDYIAWNPERLRSSLFAKDIALVTCVNGHTLRMVSTVHSVSSFGFVSPSWVCTMPGCNFHEFIELAGWNEDDAKATR